MYNYPPHALQGHRIAWRTLSGIASGRVSETRSDLVLVGTSRIDIGDIIRVYN